MPRHTCAICVFIHTSYRTRDAHEIGHNTVQYSLFGFRVLGQHARSDLRRIANVNHTQGTKRGPFIFLMRLFSVSLHSAPTSTTRLFCRRPVWTCSHMSYIVRRMTQKCPHRCGWERWADGRIPCDGQPTDLILAFSCLLVGSCCGMFRAAECALRLPFASHPSWIPIPCDILQGVLIRWIKKHECEKWKNYSRDMPLNDFFLSRRILISDIL